MTSPWANGLRNLGMGGFHQDWVDDNDTYEEVVDLFYVENSVEGIQQTIDEVDQMLSDDPDEEELDQRFSKTGACFYPPGGGLTHRSVLDYIRARGVAELQQREQ